ncbi:phage head closure protein [Aerococcaceae bacterium zg-ZJ1578]|uniref:phage head closure protein n=1 Tax=Aerococcaceae bacterium zg-252 TaxID=2796928 RepID=UPI001A1C46E4|nr:phage head closure protein [Aerococcaceae bacterium zg-1578]MBR7928450.1 phage head closure protein [Aerococcaceae bacterium zg-ZUI334]MBS4462849.1 phage head closure protein [Aerococcaceae bacterium zg-B36]
MKRAKASDMRHKVMILEQVNVLDRQTGAIAQKWRKSFYVWCREVTIFREQLEQVVSGAESLRDRLEMECRYTRKINSKQRALYDGKFYRISIVGDTSGASDRVRFLMEALEDGGA